MKLGESKKMEVEGDLGVSAANHGVWFWVPHAGASGLPDTNIFKLLQLLKIFFFVRREEFIPCYSGIHKPL
jgi:hypothetical protein